MVQVKRRRISTQQRAPGAAGISDTEKPPPGQSKGIGTRACGATKGLGGVSRFPKNCEAEKERKSLEVDGTLAKKEKWKRRGRNQGVFRTHNSKPTTSRNKSIWSRSGDNFT